LISTTIQPGTVRTFDTPSGIVPPSIPQHCARLGALMRSTLRTIAAVLLGFIVASIVMMIVESINGRFLHPDLAKAAEGIKDREAMRALLASAPVTAFLVVLVGWFLGGISGGWVAVRVAERSSLRAGLVVGVLGRQHARAAALSLPGSPPRPRALKHPHSSRPRDTPIKLPAIRCSLTPGSRSSDLYEVFVSSIARYPERWRDGPCETLATCCNPALVPIPAG
jgi:hypothetical protein